MINYELLKDIIVENGDIILIYKLSVSEDKKKHILEFRLMRNGVQHSTWQTGFRQKKITPSHFVKHIPKDQRLSLVIREIMVNYHHYYFYNTNLKHHN